MDHLHKSTEEQIINSVNKDDENYDGINASLLGKNISDTESDCEILPSQIYDIIEVEEEEHKGIDVSLLGSLFVTESDYESIASHIGGSLWRTMAMAIAIMITAYVCECTVARLR